MMDDPVNNHEMKRLKSIAANPQKVVRVSPGLGKITPVNTPANEDAKYERRTLMDEMADLGQTLDLEKPLPPDNPQDYAEGDWYDWVDLDDEDRRGSVILWLLVGVIASLTGLGVWIFTSLM